MFDSLLARSHKVKATRITSAAITAANLNVSYMFGQPRTVSSGGLTIDVDRDLSTVKAVDGDGEKVINYNQTSGIMGSYLEGSVFEQMFGGEAVSTMHILDYANQQGIAVYTINQDNVDSVLPQLEYDSAKKQEFRNLINSGKEITVPQKEVTISGWNGTGYIVENPDNGMGAYIISGGLNGGGLTIPQILALTVLIVCFSLLVSIAIVAFIELAVSLLINAILAITANILLAGPLTVYQIAKKDFLKDLANKLSGKFFKENGKKKMIATLAINTLLKKILSKLGI